MSLMVHEAIDQAHDRYQYHAQKEAIDPDVFPIVGYGLGRHGRSGPQKDGGATAAGNGQRKYSPGSRLASRVTRAAYLPAASQRNATSVTQGVVTSADNPQPDRTQKGITAEGNGSYLILALRHPMMQNRTSRFRVGAIADLSVICNWEGLDCFFGKPGLAEPSVLSKRAAVRRFSILTSWQDLVGRCGNIGLMVRPKLCAGPTDDSPSGYLVGFRGRNGCAF